MSSVAVGYGFAIAALMCWGLNNAVMRVPARRLGVVQALFYRNGYTALVTAVVFAIVVAATPASWGMVLLTVVLSGLGYLSLLAMFQAKKLGKVGVISPVSNSSVLVTVLLAVLVLGERLSLAQSAGIAAILVGLLVATVDVRALRESDLFKASSGVPFALVTALCWGVMFAFLSLPVAVLGAVTTALVLNGANFLMSVVHLRASGQRLVAGDAPLQALMLLMGALSAGAIIFYSQSLHYIDVSIATAVAFSNPLVTMFLGVILYQERHSPRALLGLLLCVGGIAASYYFR